MAENQNKIDELLAKIVELNKKQNLFQEEILKLAKEIKQLKSETEETQEIKTPIVEKQEPIKEVIKETEPIPVTPPQPKIINKPPGFSGNKPPKKVEYDTEKVIGANIISKVGIAILVLGVGIGVKYAIDKELLSPLVRIIIGYLIGGALYVISAKLKDKYRNYSAVLLGGALASAYFITYVAYSFYGLMPQVVAFGLMVLLTAFAVWEAIRYDQVVIANLGLVGAYAVPLLLSNNSGRIEILLSYMAIINTGILIIGFKKYWKSLYYSAFIITWLIFTTWLGTEQGSTEHQVLSLVFVSIFFLQFYANFLAYKVLRNQPFEPENISMLLANSGLFFGLGYYILGYTYSTADYHGLFTFINALIHGGMAWYLSKREGTDKNIIYLLVGLAITFFTITVPVQLDGEVITMIWACEAAVMFWIGRTKQVAIYESMSHPLILLSFAGLLGRYFLFFQDFSNTAGVYFTPILNNEFATAAFVLGSYSLIYYWNTKITTSISDQSLGKAVADTFIPGLIILISYFAFRFQIYFDWKADYLANNALSIKVMGKAWESNYSALFISILAFLNIIKFRNKFLGQVTLFFGGIFTLFFLARTLVDIGKLRTLYLDNDPNIFYILVRYLSLGFIALMVYYLDKLRKQDFIGDKLQKQVETGMHLAILWVLSSELFQWQDLLGATHNYKLGLSILWGCYSLMMVTLGIRQKKKHVRITAIAVFSATLLKVFFYDIAHLSTISKTIVFITLGILLLIISFLYNKFKDVLND